MQKWAVLWLLSLVATAGLASGLTIAQVKPLEPRVLSGNDLGFRVEGINSRGEPTGTLVIRVKGEWVPVGSAPTPRPLK